MTKFYPVSQPSLTSLEVEYVTRAVKSGWVSSIGEFVQAFEEGFAVYCGVDHAISVTNGTAALHLSLVALGIGPGDEQSARNSGMCCPFARPFPRLIVTAEAGCRKPDFHG